jgi:hypothetical protein
MSRAIPKLRDFAERLIAYEMRGKASSAAKTPAAFLASAKLRPSLATLMGNAGFHALLSRALALASAEVPWLRAVHAKADGSFEGLHELGGQRTPDEIVDAGIVVLAQLLGLLVAFIGEDLTLRLVREVWPKLPLNSWGVGKGDKK